VNTHDHGLAIGVDNFILASAELRRDAASRDRVWRK